MMKMNLSLYAFVLMTMLLSSQIMPSEANINLIIGEEEENPFQEGLCTILNCNDEGELGMFDYFENMWSDLTDVSVIFGGEDDSTRQRRLRGQK